MSAFKDTTIVVGGVVTAAGLTSLNQLTEGKLSMRPVIGGFIVGTALLIVAFINTPVAAALALLLMITSVFVNGAPVMSKALGAIDE